MRAPPTKRSRCARLSPYVPHDVEHHARAKAVEPDRVEIEEHQLRMESTVPMTDMMQPFGYVSVERMNDLSDTIRPIVDQQMLSPLAEGWSGRGPPS